MAVAASTSDKILDIAQSLVVTGGYNGFSYADIAAAIGIRKASIHHHFPTKAELVSALVHRYRMDAEAGLNAARQHLPSPPEQLRSYLNFWQTCLRDASLPFCICALLASEMPILPAEVAAGVRAYFHTLASWLTSVLQAGVNQQTFRLDHSPEQEAQMLMASAHGAMLSARAFGDPELFATILGPQIARLQVSAG